MMQPKSAYKHSNKESDIHVVQIALLMLFPLVIVLVWIALMYDKLLTNPILAILLVLGVLVILFGGTMRFGPIEIQRAKTTIREPKPTPTTTSSFVCVDRNSMQKRRT